MFLESLNHGIWPDILSYKQLQNARTLRLRKCLVQQDKLFSVSEAGFLKSMANYALRIIYKSPVVQYNLDNPN